MAFHTLHHIYCLKMRCTVLYVVVSISHVKRPKIIKALIERAAVHHSDAYSSQRAQTTLCKMTGEYSCQHYQQTIQSPMMRHN
jgi:hypothetical protein